MYSLNDYIFADYELSIWSGVELPSHNYPSYYPAKAYILWTLYYTLELEIAGARYHISFGEVSIEYATLTVGHGWEPHDQSSVIVSYGEYNDYSFSGHPSDIFITGDMYVEFRASSYYSGSGFNLALTVRNTTGN